MIIFQIFIMLYAIGKMLKQWIKCRVFLLIFSSNLNFASWTRQRTQRKQFPPWSYVPKRTTSCRRTGVRVTDIRDVGGGSKGTWLLFLILHGNGKPHSGWVSLYLPGGLLSKRERSSSDKTCTFSNHKYNYSEA